MLLVTVLSAQKTASTNNPAGKWKFEAPDAGEGYSSGNVEITFADNKYAAVISFTGSDYKIPADKVKFENDTLSFSVYLETDEVSVKLKFDDKDKMSGKSLYSGGEIPLTLLREKNQ
jgi:hypothetical protein